MNRFLGVVLASFFFLFSLDGVNGQLPGNGHDGRSVTPGYGNNVSISTVNDLEKHVLILNSYHPHYEWTDNIIGGIQKAFETATVPIRLHYEYMDTRRYRTQRYHELLEKILIEKHRGKTFDLIIAADNNALDYLITHRRDHYRNIPIVFCGINHFKPEMITEEPLITGVAELPSVLKTLRAALHLHGDMKEFVVLGSTKSLSSRLNLEMIREAAATLSNENSSPSFTYVIDKSTDELMPMLQQLAPHQVLILSGILYDKLGAPLSFSERTRFVRQHCPVPIYSFWEHCMGKGIVGGKVVSAARQGTMAAQMALDILNGKDPETIPVIGEDANTWQFDYNELERFNIAPDDLPKPHHIINRPPSLIEQYRTYFIGAAIIALETVIILLLIHNIIKRRQAKKALISSEKALKMEKERLSLALQGANDGLWDWNMETNEVFYSPRWKQMLGYEDDEIQNHFSEWERLILPEGRDKAWKELNAYLEGKAESFHCEFQMRHKEGHLVDILSRAFAIRNPSDNTPIRVVGTHVDITERKRMERQLQQAQKMEAIGSLAGGIAHDFNNLLFPITGLSEMLLDDLPAGSPEYEKVSNILQAAMRAADLAQQILAFSRQADHEALPVRVQDVLKEVSRLTRSTLPSNVEMVLDIDKTCGPILGDPSQIYQIAMNLITNAFHAVERKNGMIRITLSETTSDDVLQNETAPKDGCAPEKYLHLSVSDNGTGISSENMNRIFDPYFTTKPKGKGTGLGLSTVYGIVKKYNGEITITSQLDEGTTVNVYLPLIDDTRSAPAPGLPSLECGSEHILIVDDDKAIVELETLMLERLGYRVTAFISSLDALTCFKSDPNRFDLVLADMTMPHMTGDQLANEMMKIHPDIPIVICTGYSERLGERSLEKIDFKGILMKPVTIGKLAQMVRKALDDPKR